MSQGSPDAASGPPVAFARVAIKLGTNLLTGGGDRLDIARMESLVGQVAALRRRGCETVVVTSGAIAAGRQEAVRTSFLSGRGPTASRQVLAALGQGQLMRRYHDLFEAHGLSVAQTLLTRTDLDDRAGYLNARNTLTSLMELGVVPIVNENDVVATEEIEEGRFGDNDTLSALVANLVDADLLLLLTDIAGLHTSDPRRDPAAVLIEEVASVDARIEALGSGTTSERAIGGMVTKLQAAKLASSFGATVVVADGRAPEVVLRLAAGERVGTRFLPTATRRESRERWLLSGLGNRGRLVLDSGAVRALVHEGRSLLPAGVAAIAGSFARGDVVSLDDVDGCRVGCGLVNYPAAEVARIKGQRSDRIADLLGHDYGAEVVHRNNLVIL